MGSPRSRKAGNIRTFALRVGTTGNKIFIDGCAVKATPSQWATMSGAGTTLVQLLRTLAINSIFRKSNLSHVREQQYIPNGRRIG